MTFCVSVNLTCWSVSVVLFEQAFITPLRVFVRSTDSTTEQASGQRRCDQSERTTLRTWIVNPLKKGSCLTVCIKHYTSITFNLDSKASSPHCGDRVNNKADCLDESVTDWQTSSMPDPPVPLKKQSKECILKVFSILDRFQTLVNSFKTSIWKDFMVSLFSLCFHVCKSPIDLITHTYKIKVQHSFTTIFWAKTLIFFKWAITSYNHYHLFRALLQRSIAKTRCISSTIPACWLSVLLGCSFFQCGTFPKVLWVQNEGAMEYKCDGYFR